MKKAHITRVETTTSYTLTEDEVADACIKWLEANNSMIFKVKPTVEFDCSMGYLKEATVIVKTIEEH